MKLLLCSLVLFLFACDNSSLPYPKPLEISEATNQTVALASTTLTFSASGGVLPYTYSVSGSGTINSSTGVYTAPSLPSNDVIIVTDAIDRVTSTTVTSLGSPGLWLKADAGVTSTAGAVSLWADQSGHGNNFSQSNASMQPTLTTFNSFAAISFDGTTDGLANSAQSGLDLSGDNSVFFVVQTTGCDSSSSNVQNTLLYQGVGGAASSAHHSSIFCPNAAGTLGALGTSRPWGIDASPSSAVGYGSGTPLARGTVASIIVDGSVANYYADGSSAGSGGNIGTGGSTSITALGFFVNGGGVNSNGGSNDYYLKGNVLEVIVFPTALTSKRLVIECYLSEKYDLNLSSCL